MSNNSGFMKYLSEHHRAGFGGMYVVTHEEGRAEDDILNYVTKECPDCVIVSWSAATHLVKGWPVPKTNGESLIVEQQEPPDLMHQLFASLTSQKDVSHYADIQENCLVIVKDYHHYLAEKDPLHPVTLRMVRELAQQYKLRGSMLIFISPVLVLPPDIEKEFVVYEYDLPNEEEIESLAMTLIEETFDEDGGKGLKKKFEKDRRALIDAAKGLTAQEVENVFARSFVSTGGETFDHKCMLEHKAQLIQKSGIAEWVSSDLNSDDVGGLQVLKEWVEKRKNSFTPEARAFGLPSPRGVILVGSPGTGKSTCAKVIANIYKQPLIRVDMGQIFGSLVGESEQNLRELTKLAESVAPCILMIDELEKAFAGTKGSGGGDGGTTKRVFGQFLTWMQERKEPVFVVATSNDITQLPPELLRRGGRFDEVFLVDYPNHQERQDIWNIKLKMIVQGDDDYDVVELADMTKDFTGAEIQTAVESAMYDAFDEGKSVGMRHLVDSINNSVVLYTTMKEEIEGMRTFLSERARHASIPEKKQEKPVVKKVRKVRVKKGGK